MVSRWEEGRNDKLERVDVVVEATVRAFDPQKLERAVVGHSTDRQSSSKGQQEHAVPRHPSR